MKQVFNRFLSIFLLIFSFFPVLAVNAQPVCPVCVVAIGAGLGFSRWLGVDDLVSSVWIGAILMALVFWTLHWLKKKNWGFKFSGVTVFLFYYLFTYLPLYYLKIMGQSQNVFLGVDKILFGSISGTVVLSASLLLHNWLKSKNGNKSYFSYQKVVIPILALILNSLIFYLLIK